jgi:glycosyltransferase involved in cell wall biosynthesis
MEDLISQSDQLRKGRRSVIYDGLPIPPMPAAEGRYQTRKKLGLPLDRVIVLFAGQVIELKGLADLLRAWSLLHSQLREQADLIIVGDDLQKQGAYRLAMENFARELGCSSRFVGFQSNVQEWQTAADIAVVPSHAEPLGLVVLEAMSSGLPVVGCSVGGIRESVVDHLTGLLVPPHSPADLSAALARLISDVELRRRFGEQGRRRFEDVFSLQTHVGAILKEYETVLSSRQEAAAT